VLDIPVRADWVDYNGHLTDFRYLHIFGDGVDALFRRIGMDSAYRDAGHSPYTVEAQVRYLAEVRQSDTIYVTTQVLDCDPKRFWLFHRMHRKSDDTIVATGEHLFVHVDAKAAKSAPMHDAHAKLPRPAEAGRGISMRKKD
jgi:carnitine 3-dehydrogenase